MVRKAPPLNIRFTLYCIMTTSPAVFLSFLTFQCLTVQERQGIFFERPIERIHLPDPAEVTSDKLRKRSEPVLLNVYGAPELMPRNEFCQPM